MNNDQSFAVVIVAYNPDERFQRSVSLLSGYTAVTGIFVMDNSTSSSKVVESCREIYKVTIISCSGNKGIAFAQNKGIEAAYHKGYSWVLTLDHDTIVKESLFIKYLNYIKSHNCDNIGILGTDYYDIGSKKNTFNNKTPLSVNLIISSGSLLNVRVFHDIGGMKSYYFIDQVDNEYCYRLIKSGKIIIILPGVDMEHRLGDSSLNSFMGYQFYLYNQSPARTYYRTRNLIWFMKEYDDNQLKWSICNTLVKDFFRLIFEEKTFKKYVSFFKGFYDGLFDFKNRIKYA